MRRLILFLIFCPIPLAGVSAQAQDLKLPASPAEIQRMAARRPLPRVVTLPQAEKIRQVQLALKGKIQPSPTNSLASPLTLDPRNSYVENRAKLYFEWASVYTDDNEVVFDQDGKAQPRLRLFYNVTTPGYYVFDFTIENTTPDTRNPDLLFQNVFIDNQTKTPGKGTQHQIFVTDMKSPGWYVIVLSSPQGFWKFYSLEVSQFK